MLNLEPRLALLDVRDHMRKNERRGGDDRTDQYLAAVAGCETFQLVAQMLEVGEQQPCVANDGLAENGRSHATRKTLEQR